MNFEFHRTIPLTHSSSNTAEYHRNTDALCDGHSKFIIHNSQLTFKPLRPHSLTSSPPGRCNIDIEMHINLIPPTETTTVSARRVLVLAPHFDDEVFGCGGLLAQLADSGADIRVLYLTDSSGGLEITENREEYAARRRAEAQRGLDILGIAQLEVLSIPDGALAQFVDSASESIKRVIGEHHPDLILSVSPCEVTDDHRAAFAALHRALSGLRGGTDLERVMIGCRILLYEVNHPGYPNLLVDVTPELDLLTAAIDAHSSQLEMHNYREAALGVRHFRALSLPAAVTLAESYREIGLLDMITNGRRGLVRRLGGILPSGGIQDGPEVSVIVRTMDRPELLADALDSIAESSYRRVEVILVNDGGTPPTIPAAFPFPVVRVEMGTNQGRAAAANAGVDAATGEYLCFLDDDDLMEPGHLETLVGLVSAAGIRVAYTDAAVGVYELEPGHGWQEVDRRLPYSRDFDPDLLLVDNYIPFNTLIVERSLFDEAGPFDPNLEFFEDWEFLIRLAGLTPFHHRPQVTAEYRHFRGSGHHILGAQPHQFHQALRQHHAALNVAVHAFRRTEHAFWSMTCMPSTNAGSVPRLSCVSINVMEVFGIGWHKEDDNYHWGFLTVSQEELDGHFPDGDDFFRAHPGTWCEAVGYQAAGSDQIMIHATTLPVIESLVADHRIRQAAAVLNMRLMRKGPTVYSRFHCIDLADRVLG